MHPLEQEIQSIAEQYQMGNLSVEERNYLLNEIAQVRAAQECAGNEQMFRQVVQACNKILGIRIAISFIPNNFKLNAICHKNNGCLCIQI